MLEYTCISRILDELEPFIKLNCLEGEYGNFRIVGQEKDGSLLFVWDGHPVRSSMLSSSPVTTNRVVTHIALTNSATQTNVVLFVYDRSVHIVNCTVNPRRSLIAFTTLVTLPTLEKDDGTNFPAEENVYKAYTAEILPQNRIYKLYIEGVTHIGLQFLYPRVSGANVSSDREPKMLMLQHRQSIGLYTFPMARVGDKGVILCTQPETESLLKKYLWSQWDPINQRLYVLHSKKLTFVRQDGRRESLKSDDVQIKIVFTCYQFDLMNDPYEITLDLPLPISVPKWRSSARPQYYDGMPATYTLERGVNIRVISTTNGCLCVCYQHSIKEERSMVRRRSSNVNQDAAVTLEYSISMIHHGKTLTVSVPNTPRSVAENASVVFAWSNGYLIAFQPGHFIHLLNVGIDLEPSHHIIVHSFESSIFTSSLDPTGNVATTDTPLVPIISDKEPHGPCLLDVQSMAVYRISIDKDKVLAYFCESSSVSMRLAIFHYAILHARDIGMVKKMVYHLVNDVSIAELSLMFQEFLTASTYGSYKRSMAKSILQLFPFTTVETFRGQFERSADSTRTVQINYTVLPRVAMTMASAVERTRAALAEDTWRNLSAHIAIRKLNIDRFSSRAAKMDRAESLKPPRSDSVPKMVAMFFDVVKPPPNTPSIIRKMTDKAKSKFGTKTLRGKDAQTRPPSRTEVILGPAPFFLIDSQNEHVIDMDEKTKMLVDAIGYHLVKYKVSDDRVKLRSLSLEYVSCMIQQSRQLCHVVWSVFNMDDAESTMNLQIGATDQELLLFQVYERLYLAAEELAFPLPSRFLHYFIVLAFRALDLRTFLQYVNTHVLTLTLDFMAAIIDDLDDSPENVIVKCQLISKLDMHDAMECYKKWDHPIANKFIAQYIVETKLTDPCSPLEFRPSRDRLIKDFSSSVALEGSFESLSLSCTASGDAFPPLDTLMRVLRETENQSRQGRVKSSKVNKGGHQAAEKSSRLTEHDFRFIEDAALTGTRSTGHTIHANF